MADEKRKLIYELLVEAKGIAEQSKKAQAELTSIGDKAREVGSMITKGLAAAGIAVSIKAIAGAVDEYNRLAGAIKTLGLSAPATAAAMREIQNIAVQTGQNLASVGQVYQKAIQAQQAMGASTAGAGRLANAFTRDLAAQGRSASEAAAQLDMLAFAIDKGIAKEKEFASLLRDNPTYQKAAQEALGQTTEGLINMARAGEIGRDELIRINEQFIKLAEQEEVVTTFDGLINSAQIMASAFFNAAAEASGLNEAMKNAAKDGGGSFLQFLRDSGDVIGGGLRSVFNQAQLFFDLGLLSWDAFYKGYREGWEKFKERVKRDNADFVKANESIAQGLGMAPPVVPDFTHPLLIPGHGESRPLKTRKNPVEEARELAEAQRAAAEAARQREKEAIAAAKEEAEIRLRFRRDSIDRMGEGSQAFLDGQVQEALRQTDEQIKGIGASTLALQEPVLTFASAWDDVAATIKDSSYILAGSLTDLFTGATTSAKQFFSQMLAGFAQVFAQKAALEASDFLISLFAAKGAAFSGGHVVPFASGGIVGGPTMFPMAGGRSGVMGEAGPEAIMPLKRTRSGALGVAGAAPQVHLHNNTGVMMDARVSHANERLSIVLEAAQMGAGIAEERINRSMRSGYGPTAQSMAGTYGLRRKV